MPRLARIRCESTTGFYHVVIRGNNKKYIFKEEHFKFDFYEFMMEQERLGRIDLAAWCIMDNHVHVVLKADVAEMSEAFKRILIKFAMRYNTGTHSVGHVFDARYLSKAINTDEYLMQSIRYVHNNPVMAKMVKAPEDYLWSSYPVYLKYVGRLKRAQMAFVMSYFDQDCRKFAGWHVQDDHAEHLDIKEDLDKLYLRRATGIIDRYAKRYGLHSKAEFEMNRGVLDKMIIDLIDHSRLPLRKIAGILELPYSRVQRARRFEDRVDEVLEENG